MFGGPARATPALAFSTLGCPEWTWREAVDAAAELGFDAIEWRGGGDGHLSTGWTARERSALVRRMAGRGVHALGVTAYSTFASRDPAERARNAAHLGAHVELAADVGAPFVRTFLGTRDDATRRAGLVARMAAALHPLADRAAALGVTLVIEPHDDFVTAGDVAAVLRALDHPGVGVVWDPANAWAAGEPPEVAVSELGGWIRYVQVKDGVGRGDTWRLTAIGEGHVPLRRGLRALAGRGPLPPLCFEWERAWHPELAPARESFPAALASMRGLVRATTGAPPDDP